MLTPGVRRFRHGDLHWLTTVNVRGFGVTSSTIDSMARISTDNYFERVGALENTVAGLNQLVSYTTADTLFQKEVCRTLGANFAAPILQQIDTSSAYDREYFEISTTSYLVIANVHDGASYIIKSNIYKLFETLGRFFLFQQLDTSGARRWLHFVMNHFHFLVVANSYDGSFYNIKSGIYRFEFATGNFFLFQQLDTHGAAGFVFFVVDSVSYLAVANYYNGISSNIKSDIYRYDNALGRFVLFQQLDTTTFSTSPPLTTSPPGDIGYL
jgi:hypothetical protein